MQMKSKDITGILNKIIIISGISSCLSLILLLYKNGMSLENSTYLTICDINLFIMTILIIMQVVYYLIWLYHFHSDVTALFPDYPISSNKALARVLIPYYNIWGFWNIYSTYAKLLQSSGKKTFNDGRIIVFLLPFFYPLFVITKISSRIVYSRGLTHALPDAALFKIELIYIIMSIAMYIIWFYMQEIMYESLIALTKNNTKN